MKRQIVLVAAAYVIAVGLGAGALAAGGFALNWWSIDSGGSTSRGGSYVLLGTAGQADAGLLTGGSYQLSGGFQGGSAAQAAYGVTATADAATRRGLSGGLVTYTLTVTNTAATADTFDLSVADNLWETSLPPSVGPLAGGANAPVIVAVRVPGGLVGSTSDTARITVQSRGDPSIKTSVTLTTNRLFGTYLPLTAR